MGKLFALLMLGAGAVMVWRSQRQARCAQCARSVRPEAQTCVHCGAPLHEEGPTIDIEARPL